MKAILFSVAALMTMSTAAMAAVDPNAPTPSAVVDTCTLVASTANGGQNPNQGKCIGATGSYLSGFEVSTANDAAIIDLIGKLAPLAAQDNKCNAVDDEIAQAIALAAGKLSDQAKKNQALEISATVKSCQTSNTAALPGPVTPRSGSPGTNNDNKGADTSSGGSFGPPPVIPPVNPSKTKV